MERADPDTHNWCWVAVAVSVGNFYDTGPWTQCKVANTVLGQARGSTTDCCDPSHRIEPSCDTPWDLDVALRYTLSRDQMIPTPVDIGQVRNVINERRPLGFLVEFRQGGHYAAIVGYDDEADSSGVPVVHVLDPNLGMSVITSEIETLGARFGGRWTRSYYTRKGGT
ncbi:MAG TPA: papain-like cysteine protease family protein [Sorangium sp.]|nr:papain-like cysteine protease family protein [Sorangium sp.]